VTDDVHDKFVVTFASDHLAARRTNNLLRHCTTPISPDATSDIRDGTKRLRTTQGPHLRLEKQTLPLGEPRK
jgi:hypothetical protein